MRSSEISCLSLFSLVCAYSHFMSGFVLQMYILQYFRDVIDKQSWSDDGTVSDRRLREEVLSLACDFGYPPCLEKAKQLYDSWVESNGTIR